MRRILIAFFVLVVFLYFRNRSSYYCEKDQSEIIYDGKTSNCFKKGSYVDTNRNFPSKRGIEVKSGPNSLEGFYATNFRIPNWKVEPNTVKTIMYGATKSLKVL